MTLADVYLLLDDAETDSDLAEILRRANAELDAVEAEGFRETMYLYATANGFDTDKVFELD